MGRFLAAGLLVFFLTSTSESLAGGKAMEGVVNVNTAPAATLALLPGIGPAKVQSIIQYRQRRPFRTVDELVRIKGISSKMVKRLRPHLAATGPSTARVLTAREVKAAPTPVEQAADKKGSTAAAPTTAPPAAVRPPLRNTTVKPAPGGGAVRRSAIWGRANLCLPAP